MNIRTSSFTRTQIQKIIEYSKQVLNINFKDFWYKKLYQIWYFGFKAKNSLHTKHNFFSLQLFTLAKPNLS